MNIEVNLGELECHALLPRLYELGKEIDQNVAQMRDAFDQILGGAHAKPDTIPRLFEWGSRMAELFRRALAPTEWPGELPAGLRYLLEHLLVAQALRLKAAIVAADVTVNGESVPSWSVKIVTPRGFQVQGVPMEPFKVGTKLRTIEVVQAIAYSYCDAVRQAAAAYQITLEDRDYLLITD